MHGQYVKLQYYTHSSTVEVREANVLHGRAHARYNALVPGPGGGLWVGFVAKFEPQQYMVKFLCCRRCARSQKVDDDMNVV